MNRHLSPDTKCYRCTHLNGDHDHPNGRCGCDTNTGQCPCPGFTSGTRTLLAPDPASIDAQWSAWDATHNAEEDAT